MTSLQQKAKNLKILAPAGDWASLRAAVKAGADSVYFGIADFNMRATAARNFTKEDLPKINKYCREHGVETCITVNTIMYDSDLSTMRSVIDAVKKSKCDAVIVADIAALMYANKKGVPAYISTQVSVSNIEGIKFFAKYSDRIILARELTIEQVAEISKQIEKQRITGPSGNLVEIEAFGHGALCVAVSGRCALSLFCYGSSANEGKCVQVCRRKYKVTDTETGQELVVDNNYVMSPKDLCTIGMLPQLIEAGVKVLKLEGRGRPPEYVDTVVSCYREARDAIMEGTYTKKKIDEWNKRLGTVFNREFSTGLYMGRQIDEWATGPGNQATNERLQLGKVLHFYPKAGVAEIIAEGGFPANEGDECLISGPTTGLVRCKFEGMLVEDKPAKIVTQGQSFTLKVPEPVRKGDGVYIFRPKVDE